MHNYVPVNESELALNTESEHDFVISKIGILNIRKRDSFSDKKKNEFLKSKNRFFDIKNFNIKNFLYQELVFDINNSNY